MTPEPRLAARCASSGSWSPKKRRKSGSFSSGWLGARISLDVKMLTTEGLARWTAAWKEVARTAGDTGSAAGGGALKGAGGASAGTGPPRWGSQSGRNVATTNSAATATVTVCAKISQRRCIEGTESTIGRASPDGATRSFLFTDEALAARLVDFWGAAR